MLRWWGCVSCMWRCKQALWPSVCVINVVSQGDCSTREDAVTLGVGLCNSGFMHHGQFSPPFHTHAQMTSLFLFSGTVELLTWKFFCLLSAFNNWLFSLSNTDIYISLVFLCSFIRLFIYLFYFILVLLYYIIPALTCPLAVLLSTHKNLKLALLLICCHRLGKKKKRRNPINRKLAYPV